MGDYGYIHYLPLVGRFMLGFVFFYAGVCNIKHRQLKITSIVNRSTPKPEWIFWVGVSVQMLFGILLMLNLYSVIAAEMLILFTLVAAWLYHDFWNVTGDAHRMRMQGFLNNIGLIGGLLFVIYYS